jgi:transcriptional regulator with XRE-family HTH domain
MRGQQPIIPEAPVNEELATTIGNIVRTLRLQADWPLESVADALGLPPLVLARLERGKFLPSIVTLVRLSLLFGVSADTLLARPAAQA